MLRKLSSLRRSQKGLALAMSAVVLPVMALLMVFALDIGMATTAQTRLETAVNQAADMAVLRLPDETGASDMAESVVKVTLADSQRFGRDLVITVTTTPTTLTVAATLDTYAFFGGLANRDSYEIAAQAERTLTP